MRSESNDPTDARPTRKRYRAIRSVASGHFERSGLLAGASRGVPISSVVQIEIIDGARTYATRVGVTLRAVLEEALREYLSARESGGVASPLARQLRRAGRPALIDKIRQEQRLAAITKRTGRPIEVRRRPRSERALAEALLDEVSRDVGSSPSEPFERREATE